MYDTWNYTFEKFSPSFQINTYVLINSINTKKNNNDKQKNSK